MSGRIKGITIEIGGDTTKLNSALKKTDSSLKTTQTALRDIGKLLKLDPGNTVLLEQKQRNLAKAIEDTKGRLDQLKYAEEQMRGRDLTEDQQRQYEALQREIISTESDLKRLNQQMTEFGSVGAQKIALAGEHIEKFGNKISAAGDKMTGLGEKLLPVTAAITGAGIASIKTAATFEDSIASVQATLGIASDATVKLNGETVNVMESLEALARKMGAETKFSASQAADAINILAMAGLDVEQIFDGLPKLLSLAAAGDMEIARAADITTGILAGFNLETEKSGEVVDKLAKLASSAKGNVSSFGDGLSAVAGQAQATGQAFDDVATALGILGNNNISASAGGTMLQRVLKNLYQPTTAAAKELKKLGIEAYNADGSARALPEVLIDLKHALGDMNDEAKNASLSQIFDTAAIRGANALIGSAGAEFEGLKEKILDSKDAAQQMADVRMNTLNGQLQVLKSQTEEAAIAFGQALMPVITDLVKMAQRAADWINNLSDKEKRLVIQTAAVVAAAGPALIIAGKTVSAVGTLASGFGKFLKMAPKIVSGVKKVAVVFNGLGGAIAGSVGIALAMGTGLGLALKKWGDKNREFARDYVNNTYKMTERQEKFNAAIAESAEAYSAAYAARRESMDEIETEYRAHTRLVDELRNIVDENGKIKDGYGSRAATIIDQINEATGTELEIVNGVVKGYRDINSELDQILSKKRAQAILEANEEAYIQALGSEQKNIQALATARSEMENALREYGNTLDVYFQSDWIAKRTNEFIEQGYSQVDALSKAGAAWNEYSANAKANVDVTVEAFRSAEDMYYQDRNLVKNWEALSDALQNGVGVEEAIYNLTNGFLRAGEASERMLEKQVDDYKAAYDQMLQAVEDGYLVMNDEQLAGMEQMVHNAETELSKYRMTVDGEFVGMVDAMQNSFANAETTLQQFIGNIKKTSNVDLKNEGGATGESYKSALETSLNNSLNVVSRMVSDVKAAASGDLSGEGEHTGSSYVGGIESALIRGMSRIRTAASNLAGAIASAANIRLQIKSPSRVAMRTGAFYDEGLILGLQKGEDAVRKTADRVAGMIPSGNNYPYSSAAIPMMRYSETNLPAQNINVTASAPTDGAVRQALGSILTKLNNLDVTIKNAGQFADGVTNYANRRLGRISTLQESGVI